MLTSFPLDTLRVAAAFCFSALLVTACGESEGGSGGSSGQGGGTTTSAGAGGATAEVCSGEELGDCLLRCDGLNDCADAATQQACRDKCGVSTPKACVDWDACYVQDFACENSLDCWNVFKGSKPGSTGSGGGNTSCATACANVTVKCGDEGGIDFATCTEQCPSFSQTAIDCATNAADCDAILACVGAGGG